MGNGDFSIDWTPATIAEVKQILQQDLVACDAEQKAAFHRFEVEPYATPIVRYGQPESVIIVARRDNEVIYWEDVEEGFNASPVDENGTILEHWCNQDQLGHALNAWVEGRSLPGKFGPARPLQMATVCQRRPGSHGQNSLLNRRNPCDHVRSKWPKL